jgi:hypothetical protein
MAGYPILWEETFSIDQLSKCCPYEISEIEEYLFGNHYHWSLDEASTTFEVVDSHVQRQDAERHYWLFEARERAKCRQWLVVIGTGKSPFDPSKKMKRWMYAKTNDSDLSLEQFLDQEYREQLTADGRSR